MEQLDETLNAELLRAIEAEHVGLASISARRTRRPEHRVGAWTMTRDGKSPAHDERPSEGPSEIAATVQSACESDAEQHGAGLYIVTLQRAKKDRGPAPKATNIRIKFGEGDVADEPPEQRSRDLSWEIANGLWKEHRALLSESTKMITSVVTMVSSVAAVHRQANDERAAAASSSSLEEKIIALEAEKSRSRERFASQALLPLIAMLQRRMSPSGAASEATVASAQQGNALAEKARAFAATLNPAQRDKIEALGQSVLARLESATVDSDVCGIVADLASLDTSALLAAYDTLDNSQALALAEIQQGASDAAIAGKG